MTKRLAIIGAGGHGKVAADIAELVGWNEIHFFDDCPPEIYPWIVKGSISNLIEQSRDYDGFFVAIGNNTFRKKVLELLEAHNVKSLITLIHPNAIVAKSALIKEGCLIAASAVINPSVVIEKGCIVNTSSSIDHDCHIEQFSHIAPGVHLSGNVKIGKNNWIGVGSTIIQGIIFADDIYLGAGSVVVKNLMSAGLYYGNPAKFQRNIKG